MKYSKSDSVENSSKAIIGATLKIGKHEYDSNWFLANCRYDALLGMPWHVVINPSIDYQKKIVKVGKHELMITSNQKEAVVEVMNLSMKKFRGILKRKSASIQVFPRSPVNLCDPKDKF